MWVISYPYHWIKLRARFSQLETGRNLTRRGTAMTKVELAVTDDSKVETEDKQAIELTLPELDMIGGGSSAVAY
jgi:hypothetical protein